MSSPMNCFIETSVSRCIHHIIEMAVMMDDNAAIIGAPGVGKTMALDAYESSLGLKIARLTITPILARSMREIMSALCEKLEVRTWGGESIYEMERALLRRHVGNPIVIIDEAQNLSFDSLRQLLTYSRKDDGQLIFIYCGNVDILKQVNTDQGALAQISRRIAFRQQIEGITDDDADAITNSFGVEGLDAYETMRAVGQHFHADGVAQVLRTAQHLTKYNTIKKSDILGAIKILSQYQSALKTKPKRLKAG